MQIVTHSPTHSSIDTVVISHSKLAQAYKCHDLGKGKNDIQACNSLNLALLL